MTAKQVAEKLGAPKETGDRDELYAFSDTETAQVYYDTRHIVTAVTVNYLGEHGGVPTPEKVFDASAEVKPDGSTYKMVRYPQADFFIVYSRTSGDAPLVTVAMQKIEE